MLKTKFCSALFGIVLMFFTTGTLVAHENQACKVDFKSPPSPKKGDTVAISGDLSGTATVPPGMFLWVFVHRQGLAKWWPQGGGPATVQEGQWTVHAAYGDEQNPSKDANATFEVKAVVIGKKEHEEIMKYVKQSEETGHYPGISIPSTDPGCETNKLTVVRR